MKFESLVKGMRYFLFSLLFMTTNTAAPTPQQPQTILVVGDSISAAYGIDSSQGWVALLRKKLSPVAYQVINVSQSGDTTGLALARLPTWLTQYHPHLVVFELGGNDGLQGLPIHVVEQNLVQMVRMSQKQQAKVIILGIRLPANYGKNYTDQFHKIYKKTAIQNNISYVSCIYSGFYNQPGMIQDDRIHPTAKAQPMLFDNIWPRVAFELGLQSQVPVNKDCE